MRGCASAMMNKEQPAAINEQRTINDQQTIFNLQKVKSSNLSLAINQQGYYN
jgi:hypothetical protein